MKVAVWKTGSCQSAAASHSYLLGRKLDVAELGDESSDVCDMCDELVTWETSEGRGWAG